MSSVAPIIGLNCDTFRDESGAITGIRDGYWEAIERAGGIPVLIPHLTDRAALERILEVVDGVVLVGGDDISAARLSKLCGREVAGSAHGTLMTERREESDFLLLELLLEKDAGWKFSKPVLGVCLANQELAAASGGELHQHLPDELPGVKHMFDRREGSSTQHAVRIEGGSLLSKIWDGAKETEVNSAHHQGVRSVGNGLRATAWAPDGLVEALEVEDHPFFLTVQWHPERMADDARQRKLFEAVVDAARKRRRSSVEK